MGRGPLARSARQVRDHRPNPEGKPVPELTHHRFEAHRTKVRRAPETKARKRQAKTSRKINRPRR